MTDPSGFAEEGLFALLQGPALDRLPRQQVPRGTTLISVGTPADAMYLVDTGRFRVELDGVVLDEIGAGSVIGEIAFLTGQTRTANVIAARDSMVYRVSEADYAALCAAEPALPQAVAAELAERLARTSRRVPFDPARPHARTYAILPAAHTPLPQEFVARLAAAIAPHRRVATVTEEAFVEALGRIDPQSPEATAWLNAHEREADIVLFVANPEDSDWSRAALRQADQAVFVAQSLGFAPPSPLEDFALRILPENQRRLVLLHPHRAQRASGTGKWLDSRPVFLHHHVALSAGDEDIVRLGRFLAGRAIGLVLSGGGAFGVAHIGIWKAMREAGIPTDIAGGTSIGSAMAGAIALGVPPDEIGPRVEQIFVTSGAMRRVTVPKYAFLDHTTLDAALIEHFGTEPIEDLWLPYYAVAADLSSMSKRVIRRGPLWEAIRASSAIPGVLPAFFTTKGEMLVDGGCIDNMPFRDMHGLKTGPNVVVNVQRATDEINFVDYNALPGRLELLKRTVLPFGKPTPNAPGVISTVMRSLLIGQTGALEGLNSDDLHIRPPGLQGAGFLAWNKHKLFFELAYRDAISIFGVPQDEATPALAALRRAAGPT